MDVTAIEGGSGRLWWLFDESVGVDGMLNIKSHVIQFILQTCYFESLLQDRCGEKRLHPCHDFCLCSVPLTAVPIEFVSASLLQISIDPS